MNLALHLKNDQRIYFTASNVVQHTETSPLTTLTSFFVIWQIEPFAWSLFYSDMVRYCIHNRRILKYESKAMRFLVIRMSVLLVYTYDQEYTHPDNQELHRLAGVVKNSSKEWWMLLFAVVAGKCVRWPTSFKTLRTVNVTIFPTYRAACDEFNLLENDTHW